MKCITIIVLVLLLSACSQKSEDNATSRIIISFKNWPKANQLLKSVSDPASSSEFNCLGVLITYPDSTSDSSCENTSSIVVTKPDLALGTVTGGSELQATIKTLPDVKFEVVGFVSNVACPYLTNSLNIPSTDISNLYILGSTVQTMIPGENVVDIVASFTGSTKLDSCSGSLFPWVEVQSAAPSITLHDPASSPGNDATPTFEVTDITIGATIAIYTDASCTTLKGSKVATAVTDYVTSSTIAEGSYTFYANSTDTYGNISDCSVAGANYILDITGPAIPTSLTLIDPASSPANDTTPEILVSNVEAGNTVFLYTDSTCTATVQSGVATSTTISLTTLALTEGSYTFYANSTDTAGNLSACSSASVSYDLDITPPAAPSGLSLINPTTSPGNDTTLEVQITGVVIGDTVGLYSDATCSTLIQSGVATSTAISLTTPALSEGSYTFYANSTDTTGNLSSCSSASVSYDLDITPPAAPSGLSLIDPASSPGNDTTPTFEVTGITIGDTVKIYTDIACTVLKGSKVATASTDNITSSAIAEGSYTFYVNSTDPVGNVSGCSSGTAYILDVTASATPSIALYDPATSPGNNTTPTFEVTGITIGDTIAIYTDSECTPVNQKGSKVATAVTDYVTSSALAEDSYTFYTNSTDPSGNISDCSVAGVDYILDITGPVTPSITLYDPVSSPGSDTTPTFEVMNITIGDTIKLYSNSDCTGLMNSMVAIGATDYITSSELTIETTYSFYANSTDVAGNISGCSVTSAEYILDLAKSVADTEISISALSSIFESATGTQTILITLSATSANTVTATLQAAGTATEGTDYTLTNIGITIPIGSISTSANFTIVDDALDEPDETVLFSLKGLTNAKTGASSTMTITIVDEDAAPTVSFSSASQLVAELDTVVTATMVLSAASAFDVDVFWEVTGTASDSSVDHDATDGSVTILAGATSATTSFNIYDDALIESTETVILTVTPRLATNASPGGTPAHTVTISATEAVVVDIVKGIGHSCALIDTGKIRCWGLNSHGQLGYGNVNNIGDDEFPSSAGDVNVGFTATQIAAGNYHSCALSTTGAVRCWGRNNFGQLGYANTIDIGDDELPSIAGHVTVGGSVSRIFADGNRTCAKLNTDELRCWGSGIYGSLGYGYEDMIGDVSIGATAVKVQTCGDSTCIISDDSRVKCWGYGSDGGNGQKNTDHISDDETPDTIGFIPI